PYCGQSGDRIMSMRINTNIAALNALRHLNRTQKDTESTLERLSSGRKLNSAADGPAAMVISEQMKSQIESIGQAISNSETSISMIQTAEGALSEVSNILVTLRQLSIHAANEGTNDSKMLQADQNEIENLLATLRRISKNTQFGTQSLLNGSNAVSGVTVGDGLKFTSADVNTKPSPSEGYKVNITQVATRPMLVATKALGLEDAFASFVVTENGKTVALDPNTNKSLQERLNKIVTNALHDGSSEAEETAKSMIQHLVSTELQQMIDDAGLNLEVFVYKPAEKFGELLSGWDEKIHTLKETRSYPSEAREMMEEKLLSIDEEVMVIRHKDFGSKPTFTVTTSLDDFFADDAPANNAVAPLPGKDIEGTIGGNPELGAGDPAIGNGQFLTAAEGTTAEGLTIQYTKDTDDVIYEVFNRIEGQIEGNFLFEKSNDYLVGEDKPEISMFNRVVPEIDGFVHLTQNSLAFQVGPNQGQQIRVSIQNTSPESLSKSVVNESDFRSLDDISVLTGQAAQDSIKVIDNAIDEISVLRAKLGAFQKNALETNLNSLRISQENLTSSESELADSDMASDMSRFVKNQILMESGTAMLAQANQMPKAVLQLLRGNGG
ncbi:flagellin, partial [Deltaproteobacteria bacterium TL4]